MSDALEFGLGHDDSSGTGVTRNLSPDMGRRLVLREGVLYDPDTGLEHTVSAGSSKETLTVRLEGAGRTFPVISEIDADQYVVIDGTKGIHAAHLATTGATMRYERPLPPGRTRLARLVAKHRADRKRRSVHASDPGQVLDRFAQRVFGTEAGAGVLADYLREHGAWDDPESEADVPPSHGR